MGGPPPAAVVAALPEELATLAAAHRVATRYEDWTGRPVAVDPATVRAALAALGVDPDGPPPAPALPPAVVTVAGQGEVELPVEPGAAEVTCEDGTRVPLATDGHHLRLAGLPLGYHRLDTSAGSAHLIVTPDRLAGPPRKLWGWMVQLYAVRSRSSWGMGDLGDLGRLASWAGAAGAGLLLVNPLDAIAPVAPVEASPYYPSSRRAPSALYLRPQDLPTYAAAPPQVRAAVDRLGAQLDRGGLIDRDAVWAAKSAAFDLLAPTDLPPPPPGARAEVARFCAIAEVHGRDFRRWPSGAQPDPRRLAVHGWLLDCADAALEHAQRAATDAGMAVGLVHDLPVGVDPGGADAWALADVLAGDVRIGAPPDSFNQQGQDWQMPPWHPRRLAETGYAPFREVVAATLRHGGGIRVDHVMGLFRLWWIPPGHAAGQGTYVGYDPQAMLGVLALEAHRAGGLVVGEDLGTVEPSVARALAARGVLGSTVLWFADGPPAGWRRDAMASVTTHDLPTAAGFLAGEHVRVRAELGLLGRPEAEELADWVQRRDALLSLVGQLGYGEDPVLGMHAALARSPSRVVLGALGDAVGDLRQPNLPGTVDAYPNWRLPLADGAGTAVGLEELLESPGAKRIGAVLGAPDPDPERAGPGAGD